MKGRKTMIGLTFINPQYIQEAEFETVSGNSESGKPKTGHLKMLLIAAMVSTMLLLTGAGLYTRCPGKIPALGADQGAGGKERPVYRGFGDADGGEYRGGAVRHGSGDHHQPGADHCG